MCRGLEDVSIASLITRLPQDDVLKVFLATVLLVLMYCGLVNFKNCEV